VLLTNIRAARIDSTGALLDPAGISIGSAADAGARTIAWNGAQFVVLWSDGSGSHLTRVGLDGTVLDSPPIAIPGTDQVHVAAGMACAASSCLVLVATSRFGPRAPTGIS
jgi:hypothetical protein